MLTVKMELNFMIGDKLIYLFQIDNYITMPLRSKEFI